MFAVVIAAFSVSGQEQREYNCCRRVLGQVLGQLLEQVLGSSLDRYFDRYLDRQAEVCTKNR